MQAIIVNSIQARLPHQTVTPDGQKVRLEYLPLDKLSENVEVPVVGNAHEPLVIGAYRESEPVFHDENAHELEGMVCDIRLWSVHLSPKQVNDRRTKLLTGTEPGLAGYWPLNQTEPGGLVELPHKRPIDAHGVRCLPTNLQLDESLYPYVLNDVKVQWPNRERWTVRGEDAPVG